jgi:hypothetical protein
LFLCAEGTLRGMEVTMTTLPSAAPLVLSLALALALATACGPANPDEGPWLGAPGDGVWRTATVNIDGAPVTLDVEDFDGTYVLEDDIVLDARDVTPHDERASDDQDALDGDSASTSQGLAAVRAPRTWPGGVVYSRFGDGLSAAMRERVRNAMDAWEARTIIRFEVAGPGRTAFVKIVPFDQPYCRANIGYTGRCTYMWLNGVCSVGLIKHEIGHTLGLYHEQSRHDRNEHVQILWDNIKPGFRGNFSRYTTGRDVGAYNIDSLMQYSSYAFSKNGRPTIVRRDDGKPFGGYRKKIHDRDARGVNRMYMNR